MSSRIVLEGKNRLPSRVQDIVIDTGMAVTQIQNGSSSNETLASIVKNFASLENSIENSSKCLERMKFEVDKLEKNAVFVQKSIEHITDAQHKFLTMELNNYYCNQARQSQDKKE